MAKDILDKVISDVNKELTKNKKETTNMKTKLTDKTIKVSTILIIIVSLAFGIAIGVYSTNTINGVIDNGTQEKVKSFTGK